MLDGMWNTTEASPSLAKTYQNELKKFIENLISYTGKFVDMYNHPNKYILNGFVIRYEHLKFFEDAPIIFSLCYKKKRLVVAELNNREDYKSLIYFNLPEKEYVQSFFDKLVILLKDPPKGVELL